MCQTVYWRLNATNLHEIKARRLRSQLLTCLIFPVSFSKKKKNKKSRFHSSKKTTLQKTFVIVEEELDGIDADDI